MALPGSHIGFLFSGEKVNIFNEKAYYAIAQKRFVTCKDAAIIKSDKRYKKSDVIIANTQDQKTCQKFEKMLLEDMAIHGAKAQVHPSDDLPLDSDHPYSVTPVFSIDNDGNFISEGDLSTISPGAREAISHQRFVACPFFALQQTRLSGGSYREVGAIITEASNKELCEDLRFGHRRTLVRSAKEARKTEQQTTQSPSNHP